MSARCPKPLKTHWAHESRRFTIFVSWISFAPGIPRMQTWRLRACPGHALHAYILCFGSTWHTVSVTTRLRNINRLISWRRYFKVLYIWARPIIFFLDSIWARWKCAQCVDLIQGFLELVGDPPGNENSESYGLRRPGLDLAGASCIQGVFDHDWAFL